MGSTTIKLQDETKNNLNTLREYKNESYDEIVNKLIYIAKNTKENPELSQETVIAIEKARERMRKGNYVTEEQAEKRLGLK